MLLSPRSINSRSHRAGADGSAQLLTDIGQAGTSRGSGTAPSAAGEGGFAGAAFQEAAHAGPLVLGAEQGGEVGPLDLQAGAQVHAEALVDGLLGRAQRQGGAAHV